MKFEHTPGPWIRCGYLIDKDGHTLAQIWNRVPILKDTEARANARLIAEAPAMLEALIKITQDMKEKDIDNPMCKGKYHIPDYIRISIENATGKKIEDILK